MKDYLKKLILLFTVALVLLISCSKSDTPEASTTPSMTVYKNQSTDASADALQAEHKDSKGTLNFYGNFDAVKNPTTIKTLTYQKVNNDTIVNFTIDPVTSSVNSTFISVKGIKSPVVIKFDYTTFPGEIGVSYHNYNWDTKISSVIYATRVKNNSGVISNKPY